MDPVGVAEKAKQQLQYWTRRKAELAPLTNQFRAQLEPREQGVLGKLDLYLLQEMAAASEHADSNYVAALSEGFKVTGDLDDGSLGIPIPGGQRVHGRPGLGGVPPLQELREHCRSINERTIRVAQSKLLQQQDDKELLEVGQAAPGSTKGLSRIFP